MPNGSALERRRWTETTDGLLCVSTDTSLGLSISSENACRDGQVNSPALMKPKNPVQHAAQSIALSACPVLGVCDHSVNSSLSM